MKPHIQFINGRWGLREIRQMWIFGDGGAYGRLARPAREWCQRTNSMGKFEERK